MSYDKRRHAYKGFSCWVNKNYGKERCTSHAIGWQTLNRLVLEDINRQAELAQSSSERYVEMLTSLKAEKQQSELVKYRRNLAKAEKRLRELDTILNKLYEDYALDKISIERYTAMSTGYEEEHRKLTTQKGDLVTQVEEGEKVFTDANQFVNLIRQYTQIQKLNAKILNELIDRIVVYEKSVDPEGNKRQWVMIYYKFIGCIQKTSPQ